MNTSFSNAQEAFEYWYDYISKYGKKKPGTGTTYLKNVGFYIMNPQDNRIRTTWRKWSKTYADREWAWYLSRNRSVKDLVPYAPIWDIMHNGDFIVNSNYGYQWNRNEQLLFQVVLKLKENPDSRQAVVTIYDGKEHKNYSHDTPCTLNLYFAIEDGRLCMSVLMRSNDLWYGFCNDQYCFSLLQAEVAGMLGLPVGYYYHFVCDFHIYQAFIGKNPS